MTCHARVPFVIYSCQCFQCYTLSQEDGVSYSHFYLVPLEMPTPITHDLCLCHLDKQTAKHMFLILGYQRVGLAEYYIYQSQTLRFPPTSDVATLLASIHTCIISHAETMGNDINVYIAN